MPTGLKLQFDPAQVKTLQQGLESISSSGSRRVIAKASTKAMKPITKTARGLVPVDSGLLKKSLGSVQRRYASRGVFYTAVGPRSGFAKQVNGKNRDPRFYAHLVEFGVKNHPKAKSGMVTGKAFLRKSFEQNKRRSLDIVAEEVRIGIGKEVDKAAARMKK